MRVLGMVFRQFSNKRRDAPRNEESIAKTLSELRGICIGSSS